MVADAVVAVEEADDSGITGERDARQAVLGLVVVLLLGEAVENLLVYVRAALHDVGRGVPPASSDAPSEQVASMSDRREEQPIKSSAASQKPEDFCITATIPGAQISCYVSPHLMRRNPILPASTCLRAARMAAILLACAALGACGAKTTEATAEEPAIEHKGERVIVPAGSPLRERLKIEPAGLRDVRHHLAVPASVEAEPTRLARISPPVAGRISKLHVKFGDEVKVGQALFDLDSPDIASAQSDYLRAQSTLAQSERNVARQQDLGEHGIGAKRDVEQAQTERDLARQELQRAKLRLGVLGGGSGRLGASITVTSPIAGRVIDLACAPGEFRNDLSVPLMTVADLSTVWVTANVQERDLRLVEKGEEAMASFVAYPGETFPGHVLLVGDLLEPDTRTIKVRVAFDNAKQRLKPGMFSTVTFTSPAVSSVVIPTPALVLSGDKSCVYVEIAPGEYERRAVVPGEQQSDVTLITHGLDAGARVVTVGAVLLQ